MINSLFFRHNNRHIMINPYRAKQTGLFLSADLNLNS